MLARIRDWLFARVKTRTVAEAAQAKTRAALMAPEMPSANFVDELERALGRANADDPHGSDALDNSGDGVGECVRGQQSRLRERGNSHRPLPFVRRRTPPPHDDLQRR